MGLVRKESLVVFHMSQKSGNRCILKKKWEIQVDLA